MEQIKLRQQLEQLHSELARTGSLDPETARILADLDRDIRALLKRPDNELSTQHHGLTANLRAALVQFEATYPNLTLNIERLLDAFNEMGI